MSDYSVILPAYNEAVLIAETLEALGSAMALSTLVGEVIVVDNNSTDDTAKIAQRMGARVLFEPINQISRARNLGAQSASGKYLIFLDADSRLTPDLLRLALASLESGGVIGGGALVQFPNPDAVSIRLWNWVSVTFGLAAGSFIYTHAGAFHQVGGFSEKLYAAEELNFSRKLKSLGKKTSQRFEIIRSNPLLTSPRKLEWHPQWKILITFGMLMLFPLLLRFPSCLPFWYKRPS